MASVITATTTSGLTQSADNSGVLQLASGTGNLVTVPSVTGTAMVSGNMPAFSAWQSTFQSVTANAFVKALFQTEEFDTANCYNNSTSVFTPNVAGYYQVNACCAVDTFVTISVFKNGSEAKRGTQSANNGMGAGTVSALIQMNGTTDYLEIYVYCSTTNNTSNQSVRTYFQAYLARTT